MVGTAPHTKVVEWAESASVSFDFLKSLASSSSTSPPWSAYASSSESSEGEERSTTVGSGSGPISPEDSARNRDVT